jgi:dihydroxy-acid dehydratase
MMQIKDHLHLDAITVTGRTVGENLKELERQHFIEHVRRHLDSYKVKAEDVIFPAAKPRGEGTLGILEGNLAPGHAVIKYAAVPKEMFRHTGPAIVFEDEISARAPYWTKHSGSVIDTHVGPLAAACQRCSTRQKPWPPARSCTTTALITDGRFSGASVSPCITLAWLAGPIAIVETTTTSGST